MDIELNYQLIGKRLRTFRKNKHLTQEKIAELTDLSPQHISGIERGTAPLSLPALVRLCNALEITPDQVLTDSLKAAAPIYLKDVAETFADCSSDELFLMLSQAENLKKSLRLKKLYLSRKEQL